MATEAKKEAGLSAADTALVLGSQQELKALVKKVEGVLDTVKTDINKILESNKESVRKTGREVKEINLRGGYWGSITLEIVGTDDQGMAQKLSTAQATIMNSPDFNYSDKLQKLMRYLGDEYRFLLDLLHKVQLEFMGKKPITEVSAILDGLRDLCALLRTRIQQVEEFLQ
ncbi:hypothetical protein KY310_03455 [Candidatus Woesearchaeota archaeon]|nr:hypothetical protein [Candidatus Woesearchaeota archaeon]